MHGYQRNNIVEASKFLSPKNRHLSGKLHMDDDGLGEERISMISQPKIQGQQQVETDQLNETINTQIALCDQEYLRNNAKRVKATTLLANNYGSHAQEHDYQMVSQQMMTDRSSMFSNCQRQNMSVPIIDQGQGGQGAGKDNIQNTGKKMHGLQPVCLHYKQNKISKRRRQQDRMSSQYDVVTRNFLMAKSALNSTSMSINQENVQYNQQNVDRTVSEYFQGNSQTQQRPQKLMANQEHMIQQSKSSKPKAKISKKVPYVSKIDFKGKMQSYQNEDPLNQTSHAEWNVKLDENTLNEQSFFSMMKKELAEEMEQECAESVGDDGVSDGNGMESPKHVMLQKHVNLKKDSSQGGHRKTMSLSSLMQRLPENRKQSLASINLSQQNQLFQASPCHPKKPRTIPVTPLIIDSLPILPETEEPTIEMPTHQSFNPQIADKQFDQFIKIEGKTSPQYKNENAQALKKQEKLYDDKLNIIENQQKLQFKQRRRFNISLCDQQLQQVSQSANASAKDNNDPDKTIRCTLLTPTTDSSNARHINNLVVQTPQTSNSKQKSDMKAQSIRQSMTSAVNGQSGNNNNINSQQLFLSGIDQIKNRKCFANTTAKPVRHNEFSRPLKQTDPPTSQKNQPSNQEQVFIKLLCNEMSYPENNYCVDCGWRLIDPQVIRSVKSEGNLQNYFDDFRKVYVSMNHGIFLCGNCARIHQENYSQQVSFIKPVVRLHSDVFETYESSQGQIGDGISDQGGKNKKVLEKWSQAQLRVLLVSGGNLEFCDYMNQFDLMIQNVQSRYSSTAAQYYRDHLTLRIYGHQPGTTQNLIKQQPDYATGRQRFQNRCKHTPQIVPYSNLDQSQILKDLLKKNRNGQKCDLNQMYKQHVESMETGNIKKVIKLQRLCIHEYALDSNDNDNREELDDISQLKQQIINEINPCIEPYFRPISLGPQNQIEQMRDDANLQNLRQISNRNITKSNLNKNVYKEPFSDELEVNNQNENLIDDSLEHFTGKTRRDVVLLSDNLKNQLNVKVSTINKPILLKGGNNNARPVVTSCYSEREAYRRRHYRIKQKRKEKFDRNQNYSQMIQRQFSPPLVGHSRQPTLSKDYGTIILEQAPRALNRLHEYLGRNVISNISFFNNKDTTMKTVEEQ